MPIGDSHWRKPVTRYRTAISVLQDPKGPRVLGLGAFWRSEVTYLNRVLLKPFL